MIGRAGSRVLGRHAVVTVGPGGLEDMQRRAARRFLEIWESMRDAYVVVWFDNMVRPRSYRNPGRGYLVWDCTPVSVLHTIRRPEFVGYPDHIGLNRGRRSAVNAVMQYIPILQRVVQGLAGMVMHPSGIRVPLDLARTGVKSLRWTPLMVSPARVTTQNGLVDILRWCTTLPDHCGGCVPLCVDENIHYRVLRLLYSRGAQGYDFRTMLGRSPVLYGVWHAYKYCCISVERKFFPLFIYLMNGTVAVDSTHPSGHILKTIEYVLAAILLQPKALWARVAAAVRVDEMELQRLTTDTRHLQRGSAAVGEGERPPMRDHRGERMRELVERLRVLRGLHRLAKEYAPLCFALGWQVRNCNWDGRTRGSGVEARKVLMGALVALIHLYGDKAHTTEYVRTLFVALALWTRWHDELPGACYTDEMCEARLHLLGQWWLYHKEVLTVEQLSDLYLMMPMSKGGERDLKDRTMGGEYVEAVYRRVDRLLSSSRLVVTYVPWTSRSCANAHDCWDDDFSFLPSLYSSVRKDSLQDLGRYAVTTLCVGHTALDPQQMANLGVPRRARESEAEHLGELQDIVRYPERFRRVAQRRRAEEEPAAVPVPKRQRAAGPSQ